LLPSQNPKQNKKRVFTIVDTSLFLPILLHKKYASLQMTSNEKHSRFFTRYKSNKCAKQPVEKSTFGKMPKTMAKYHNLPNANRYTGHIQKNISGTDYHHFKRHGGWKSLTVAEGYTKNSSHSKNKILHFLFFPQSSQLSLAPLHWSQLILPVLQYLQ